MIPAEGARRRGPRVAVEIQSGTFGSKRSVVFHGPDFRLAFLVDAASLDEAEGTMFVDVLEVQDGDKVFVRLHREPFASVSNLWLPESMIKGLPGSGSTAATVRAVYGIPYDTWRLERADGTHLYDVRLLPGGTFHRFMYFVLGDDGSVCEGMGDFETGSYERVRDVFRAIITAVVHKMLPNAQVTVEWSSQRGMAHVHAASTVRREP